MDIGQLCFSPTKAAVGTAKSDSGMSDYTHKSFSTAGFKVDITDIQLRYDLLNLSDLNWEFLNILTIP